MLQRVPECGRVAVLLWDAILMGLPMPRLPHRLPRRSARRLRSRASSAAVIPLARLAPAALAVTSRPSARRQALSSRAVVVLPLVAEM